MELSNITSVGTHQKIVKPKNIWVWDILLIGVLLLGAYFRFVGISWDGTQHLHPDERFLTMVETSINPVKNIAEYFNTDISSLNPHNVGYGFFVYGTFPIYIVRYIAEWVGMTGYDEVNIVGRCASAVFDLGVVLLIYLIVIRLYKNYRMALLAAAFSSFSVLQIQLSHFFTVDTFANFFIFLAFYFAVRIMTDDSGFHEVNDIEEHGIYKPNILFQNLVSLWPYILFGLALGMAASSKVSTAPAALLLPGAVLIRYLKLDKIEKSRIITIFIRNMVISAIAAFIIFRICQPMAFSGPGIFGIKPNDKWVQNLKDLSQQSSGDVDFPPALQWARRPITFALSNMVEWGMGLPLGILAWMSFIIMGWKIIKGEGKQNILVWGWTLIYFTWQSINFTRAMRYQLAVYPSLAIIAAWGIFTLGGWGAAKQKLNDNSIKEFWKKGLVIALGLSILGATIAWAYAFTRIYTRPVTRVAASEWIYQNVPGAINLSIESDKGMYNQPEPFRSGVVISLDKPLLMSFKPISDGVLTGVSFSFLSSGDPDPNVKTLSAVVSSQNNEDLPLSAGVLTDIFAVDGDPRGKNYDLSFENSVTLEKDKTYFIKVNILENNKYVKVAGSINLKYINANGMVIQALPDPVNVINSNSDYLLQFSAKKSGILKKVSLPHVVSWEGSSTIKKLQLTVEDISGENKILGVSEISSSFLPENDVRGKNYDLVFNTPIILKADSSYTLHFKLVEGNGSIAFYGSRQANESSWDDVLPVGLDGYNPFDYSMGVYRSDLNFEMYWDDNEEKRERFISNLDQADYIFISSNRQWGTTVRVPERYPLTSIYYRNLIGCPENSDILWCYSVATPQMFSGTLGFDLVHIEQSEPNLFNWTFNTQFAEEAFTVYDHPKVLIFKKNSSFDSEKIQSIFNSIDLTNVVHVTPRQAKSYPGNLMLPESLSASQRAGGTWADLFHRGDLLNRYPGVGAVIWYLALLLIGLICYPLTRFVLGGLPDKGYPVSRLVGLLLLSYLVWIAGSNGIPFNKETISVCLTILLIMNIFLFYRQNFSIIHEWNSRRKYFLIVEGIILAIFLIDLFVRIGNPDLWHPYKGGEKPMDFSYLNAVLKSTNFPPYDPWFSGGYINYYYYGFVIVGVLIKFLGLVPSISYNLILPTLFVFVGMGAFSIGYNLFTASAANGKEISPEEKPVTDLIIKNGIFAGITSSVALLFIGNLGTVRMIWQGLQKLAAPGPIEGAGWIQSIVWSFQGIIKYFEGNPLPYSRGDWYWIPSRTIPGEPITEFPAFSFLYADPHAHLFALGITLLVLLWSISIILGKWRWEKFQLPVVIFMGGLIIGSLRPTNTWDLPVYLGLGIMAVAYSAFRYRNIPEISQKWISPRLKQYISVAFAVCSIAVISFLLYQPFSNWYGQAYTSAGIWDGDHTPFWSYTTHWGLFLFVIISWMLMESVDWMARTPISALNKLRPYKIWIQLGLILIVSTIIGLLYFGIEIAWVTVTLIVWDLVLLFRPKQTDIKKVVLIMIGIGLALTLTVELVVLKGDIGRMNTVFKFYLQAWTLLSLSSATCLIWIIPLLFINRNRGWRNAWQVIVLLMIGGTILFPILAGMDKINDRISNNAPHSLDGMAYMPYSTFNEDGTDIDLGQDYRAILWMQDNIKRSPVIVEANTPEYRWGSRYTIYTGLPGVAGWNWHQRQQRAIVESEIVTKRISEISNFYQTNNKIEAAQFLNKYGVEYIIVGLLEKVVYSENGLNKFSDWNGGLWERVYQDGDTAIYKVKNSSS